MSPPGPGFLNGGTGAIPSRSEAVLSAIRHAILAGELRPGQSLVEAELAQRLGVSKTPVREALPRRHTVTAWGSWTGSAAATVSPPG